MTKWTCECGGINPNGQQTCHDCTRKIFANTEYTTGSSTKPYVHLDITTSSSDPTWRLKKPKPKPIKRISLDKMHTNEEKVKHLNKIADAINWIMEEME